MTQPPSPSALAPLSGALKVQRRLLALCIVLAPVSISLYVLTWSEDLRQPLVAAAVASPTANALHLIGGVAASFFLPLGYLGMSLLGMRRSPGVATLAVALSLVGWIPWPALIGLDDLAYAISQAGSSPQLAALWVHFNSDAVMTTYLLIYIIGHLLSAVLIAFMLGRLHVIPAWAAWALALTSPLTILYFPVPGLAVKNALKYLICVLFFVATWPAALAMLQDEDFAPGLPTRS